MTQEMRLEIAKSMGSTSTSIRRGIILALQREALTEIEATDDPTRRGELLGALVARQESLCPPPILPFPKPSAVSEEPMRLLGQVPGNPNIGAAPELGILEKAVIDQLSANQPPGTSSTAFKELRSSLMRAFVDGFMLHERSIIMGQIRRPDRSEIQRNQQALEALVDFNDPTVCAALRERHKNTLVDIHDDEKLASLVDQQVRAAIESARSSLTEEPQVTRPAPLSIPQAVGAEGALSAGQRPPPKLR